MKNDKENNISSLSFIPTGANIPTTKSPISQAIVAGNYYHTCGQLFVDLNGEFIDRIVQEQAEIAFKNIFAILKKLALKKMTSFK